MDTIPFAAYAPDLASLVAGTSSFIQNVVPKADGYGPFKTLQAFTAALPAACRGFFFARKSDGSIAVFAGTSTRLYLLDNTLFTWTDMSIGGAAYAALSATDNWQFAQFNDLVIATQQNVAPQKYTLSGAGPFALLGGSPPFASHVAIVGFFVMLTGLQSFPRRVIWSDLDGPETWTAGVGLSDFEDLPDGGTARAVSGGDSYGLIFQDASIRSLTYAPGSAAIFQITRISTNEALFGKYSVINVGERTFYCGAAGFKMVESGGKPVPIGKEQVDRTFFADIDRGNLQLLIGASDPTATRVYWAYKSQQGDAGLFDKVLIYDYALKRWTVLTGQMGEYLATLAKPGITLEQLDAIALPQVTVTGAANNGAGLIRLTLSALSAGTFNIVGQNFIVVQGVVGTTEANGAWHFTVIDPTHIDLTGSAFVNAYVSGGAIGGSLDSLPFSLDSFATSTAAQLAAFNSDHKLGFFDGVNLEAIVETAEQDAKGSLFFISALRGLTDCATAFGSVGGRMSPGQVSVDYSSENQLDDQGMSDVLVETRYPRGRLRMPAGAVWTYANGVQPDGTMAGDS